MADTSITNLEEYKRLSEKLKSEINLAILDYEFKKNGKLIYAVDFSEIFVYILSARSFEDFIVFPDAFNDESEIADATALQQLVLRYIFFHLTTDPKLVLLSPYVLEFRTFITKLQQKVFEDLVKGTIRIFAGLDEILEKNLNSEIDAICSKIEDKGMNITHEENEKLANFVQDYGYIQSFLEGGEGDEHPFSRAKQLRPDKVFVQLKEIFPDLLPVSSDIYYRWVSELYDLRHAQERYSSTELDAAAMNLIYEINRKLDQDTHFILITRSQSMHQLYQKEIDDGLWEECGKYPLLRHPRVFSGTLAIASKSNSEDIQDLLDFNETIDLFLKNYETGNKDSLIDRQELINQIDKIKLAWKRIQKTAFPLSSQPINAYENTNLKIVKQARTILHYLRNDKDIKKIVVQNIDRLFYDIDFAHDILGLEMQLPLHLQDKEQKRGYSVIRISPLFHRFRVIFYTDAGKTIDKLLQKPEIQVEEIIYTFKELFERDGSIEKQEEDYERNLAMAYLFCLINNWEIAENYCERAIKIGERRGISTHEATYFQSVCKRQACELNEKGSITDSEYGEILKLFDKAIAVAKIFGIGESTIARYWVEKGISILLFHKKYGSRDTQLPTILESLRLLGQWDEKLGENIPLKLFVLKTEIEYIDKFDKRGIYLLKKKFNLLENLLIQLDNDRLNWPSYVIDIMTWGEWILGKDEYKDHKKYAQLVKQLKYAASKEKSDEVRGEIQRHIDVIDMEGKTL